MCLKPATLYCDNSSEPFHFTHESHVSTNPPVQVGIDYICFVFHVVLHCYRRGISLLQLGISCVIQLLFNLHFLSTFSILMTNGVYINDC